MNPLPKIRLYLEYFLIALVLIGGCTTVTYYFKAQQLKHRVEVLSNDLTLAETANSHQVEAIRFLVEQIELREGANQLLKSLNEASSKRADEAMERFRRLRDDPVVNDWANEPLPDRLLKSGSG